MIPAVKCLPVPSITFAPVDGKFLPIFAIFPFWIKTSVSFKFPSFSPVQTVTFLKRIVSCFGFSEVPNETFGYVTAYIDGTFGSSFLSSFFLSSLTSEARFVAVQEVSFPFSKTAFPCIIFLTKVPESLTKFAFVVS